MAPLAMVLLSACGEAATIRRGEPRTAAPPSAVEGMGEVAVTHARNFRIEHREGRVLVHMTSALLDSARRDTSDRQTATLLLVPRGDTIPASAFPGALRVVVPLERIAINSNNEESFLLHLGVAARLVAVGGVNSYDDSVRAAVTRGAILQLGYGWYRAPDLDVAVAADPDALILRVIKPADTPSLDRARALGLTAIPYLGDTEDTYLGKAEWIKWFGLLTGRAATADSIFRSIVQRVDSLKALVGSRPRRPFLWAYSEGADRWQALVRGPIAQQLQDAGGLNLLQAAEDPRLPDQVRISTERLLAAGEEAECWFAGDGFPEPLPRNRLTMSLRPWRERCVFFNNGRVKPEADAWDWFQRAPVRPDVVLAEFIKALHPSLITTPFDYLVPNRDYTAP